MYEIKVEPAFKADYARVMKRHPRLRGEFKEAVSELMRTGAVPNEYGPHELSNPGGNYNGHIDFHLSDGMVDVVVLYMPHKSNPIIRLVRMGSHDELFQGPPHLEAYRLAHDAVRHLGDVDVREHESQRPRRAPLLQG